MTGRCNKHHVGTCRASCFDTGLNILKNKTIRSPKSKPLCPEKKTLRVWFAYRDIVPGHDNARYG